MVVPETTGTLVMPVGMNWSSQGSECDPLEHKYVGSCHIKKHPSISNEPDDIFILFYLKKEWPSLCICKKLIGSQF